MENSAISASILRGWSYQKAKMMGMPHIRNNGRCIICGKLHDALGYHSQHHIVPKGIGQKVYHLQGMNGCYELLSPLMRLCGSGTTGCHSDFHSGRYSIEWVWHDFLKEALWFLGALLDAGIEPHSNELFEYGHYSIYENGQLLREVYHG